MANSCPWCFGLFHLWGDHRFDSVVRHLQIRNAAIFLPVERRDKSIGVFASAYPHDMRHFTTCRRRRALDKMRKYAFESFASPLRGADPVDRRSWRVQGNAGCERAGYHDQAGKRIGEGYFFTRFYVCAVLYGDRQKLAIFSMAVERVLIDSSSFRPGDMPSMLWAKRPTLVSLKFGGTVAISSGSTLPARGTYVPAAYFDFSFVSGLVTTPKLSTRNGSRRGGDGDHGKGSVFGGLPFAGTSQDIIPQIAGVEREHSYDF